MPSYFHPSYKITRLSDPTIKMEVSAHTPVEELSNYPPEKIKELLETNKSGFKQR